jgi:hypothetical protein
MEIATPGKYCHKVSGENIILDKVSFGPKSLLEIKRSGDLFFKAFDQKY